MVKTFFQGYLWPCLVKHPAVFNALFSGTTNCMISCLKKNNRPGGQTDFSTQGVGGFRESIHDEEESHWHHGIVCLLYTVKSCRILTLI